MSARATAGEGIFAPVRSQTAFEETLDRLATAIKLGLLEPGAQLPAERELCSLLQISRSTLRQALTALVESGHLRAARGRGGGTFVADRLPPADPPTEERLGAWQELLDERLAVELGVAVLAAERATPEALDALDEHVAAMEDAIDDYPSYRQADILFHIGLAEATGSLRLVTAATDAQSAMTDLIAHIAHPAEVLRWANAQHAAMLSAMRARDEDRAVRVMTEHVRGTEHVLQGLLP